MIMNSIERLITKYKESGLDWKESIDLVQGLLDTDMHLRYPEFEQICQYYLTEGLVYYVPCDSL